MAMRNAFQLRDLIMMLRRAMRILLVEDEPMIALDAEATLVDAGHEVIGPYRNQIDAMNAARRENPDIAVVDINLAGHTEGVAIARELLDHFGIHSLFATGQPEIAREHRSYALGVLQKPYSPKDLAEAMPVLARIVEGGTPPPPPIPAGLELFQ